MTDVLIAGIGAGGGNSKASSSLNLFQDLSELVPWAKGKGDIKPSECSFDEHGNIFYKGRTMRGLWTSCQFSLKK
jgi:hypothetical protein